MEFIPILDIRVRSIQKLSDEQKIKLVDYLCEILLCTDENGVRPHEDVAIDLLTDIMWEDRKIVLDVNIF